MFLVLNWGVEQCIFLKSYTQASADFLIDYHLSNKTRKSHSFIEHQHVASMHTLQKCSVHTQCCKVTSGQAPQQRCIYFSAFATFPFFLPLPGIGLLVLRGRAFPPLTLKSMVTICTITPSKYSNHEKPPHTDHHGHL